MKVDELVKTCECDNMLLLVDKNRVGTGNYQEYAGKDVYSWQGYCNTETPYRLSYSELCITTVEAKQEAYWND